MYHPSHNVKDSDECIEEDCTVVVGPKLFYLYDEQKDKINNLLCDFPFRVDNWGNVHLEDFRFKGGNDKVSIQHVNMNLNIPQKKEFYIIDINAIPEAIITGGKTKFNSEKILNKKRERSESFKNLKKNLKPGTPNGKCKCKCQCGYSNSNNQRERKKDENVIENITILQNGIPDNGLIDKYINDIMGTSNNPEEFSIGVRKMFSAVLRLYFGERSLTLKRKKENKTRKRKKFTKLTEDEKKDFMMKINNLNWLQVQELENYLPAELYNGGNIRFHIDSLKPHQMIALYQFLNDCHVLNTSDPEHKTWREQNTFKPPTSEVNKAETAEEVINEAELNHQKSLNFILSEDDMDISESLSSSEESGKHL